MANHQHRWIVLEYEETEQKVWRAKKLYCTVCRRSEDIREQEPEPEPTIGEGLKAMLTEPVEPLPGLPKELPKYDGADTEK